MAVEVKIPAVGESITSGVVSVWHKKSGDFVNAGDALFTLETDKVSTEIAAETSGVLDTIVNEGQEVKIGEIVATIDDSKKSPDGAAPTEKKKGKTEAAAAPAEKKSKDGEGTAGAASLLSPAVRRIVDEEHLDPTKISGTGSGGRITKADAVAAVQNRGAAGDKVEAPSQGYGGPAIQQDRESAEGRIVRKKMSPLRRKIAAQLVMSQQTTATLTTFNECDMSAVQDLRAKSQDMFTKKHGVKLGFMSFFIKASVEALKTVPVVNGRIEDEDFIYHNFYDIGVAVGTERGLVVPIVRDANNKSFADLERDIANYATKAREGKLKIEDLTGGTFTVSNGGVYGSLLSTPILNPPQTGILGMHKIMPRPVAIDGKVEVRPMMYLALSYDHRAIDGKEAVTFLIKVKECIEDPKKLPLDF
jgi:2-oxoglutarate dehydrogenase E2 component (dihydrolipoamide succinyltransferase)